MFTEFATLIGSITNNVPVTPNFFYSLLNRQKDPTTFSDIIIGIRLAVYQLIDIAMDIFSK